MSMLRILPARSPVPERIRGYPTEVTPVRVGDGIVELVTVHELERLVDRQRLLLDESFEPPYWALLWSGARVLAEHLWWRDCAGSRVLDAGAGLGLVSMVAARAGACVTAVDRSPEAMDFLRASAQRGGLAIECVMGDVTELGLAGKYDIAVAAELLYERGGFAELAAGLCRAVAPAGELVIADAQRIDTTDFYEELTRLGMRPRLDSRVRVEEEGVPLYVRLVTFGSSS